MQSKTPSLYSFEVTDTEKASKVFQNFTIAIYTLFDTLEAGSVTLNDVFNNELKSEV